MKIILNGREKPLPAPVTVAGLLADMGLAERRVAVDSELVLVCHASPGSQTSGLSVDLDSSVTVERVTKTDARIICCGTSRAMWVAAPRAPCFTSGTPK